MKKILFFIMGMLCFIYSLYGQQPQTIKGIVRAVNSDKPLEGVTLVLKKSQTNAISNGHGFFTITPSVYPDTLVVSYIGFSTKYVPINDSNVPLFIRLEPTETHLKEVVVSTGYQKIPEERVTGSFDFIDNKILNQQVGSNILDRLDGVASGVLFPKQYLQDGPEFMVRGFSTINGPKDPLIIVDNFPYDGDINNINPNDVESITILKDAAASSIWGTKAGNGVVVITTKKGRFNQPLKVDFNSNIIITGKPDLLSLRTISSSDYIDIEQMLFEKGYYNSYLNDTRNYRAVSPVVEILAKQKARNISSKDATAKINNYKNVDIRKQYRKYLYRQAITQQYSINLHGGSGNIAYYLSAGYDKTRSQLDVKNDRMTIRSENSYRPVKNLLIEMGVQYTDAQLKSGRPGYGMIKAGQWQIPYLQFATPNGNPLPVAMDLRSSYTDTAGSGRLLSWKYYPLNDWKHNITRSDNRDILANIGIKYRLFDGLDINVKYLYERQLVVSKNLKDTGSYSARNMINRFSQIDHNTGNIDYIIPLGSVMNLSNTILESQNIRAQINFSHTWKKHSFITIIGNEIRQSHTTGNGNTFYGYDDNTGTAADMDFINPYPSFINGRYNTISNGVFFSDQLHRFVSYYGNLAYTYNKKYTLTISGRRDASNLFGVSTNNKWIPLWSAGLGWEISKETFFDIDKISFMKLRITYGFSGNADPARSGVTTLVDLGPRSPTNFIATRVNQFPNPDLRWEKVKTINVGIDFSTAKDVISGSVEYYFKKGSDLFGPFPVDPTLGLNGNSSLTKNVASMKGKGIDFKIKTRNFDKRFKWHSTFLFNYNKDKTTNYYIRNNLLSGSFIGDGRTINPLPGKPLYSIITLPWAGLDSDGNPQGYVDKKVSTDYHTIVQKTPKEDLIYKSSLPTIWGSMINTFSWKGINLTANISYRLGYYFMTPSISYSALFKNGAGAGSSDYSVRWQKSGDEEKTNVPSMIYPADNNRDIFYNNSEILLTKAANIKFQYINLSYDVSRLINVKNPFNRLQLSLNISNIGILWKANKKGIDPDYISSPIVGKSYSLGLRASF